jgi:hypothetical protein
MLGGGWRLPEVSGFQTCKALYTGSIPVAASIAPDGIGARRSELSGPSVINRVWRRPIRRLP